MKLTKTSVDKMVYEKHDAQRDVRWDDAMPGFGVRIYPPASDGGVRKVYVLSYRASGRKRLITLGYHGVLTLDQARTMAREKLVEIDQGEDPLTTRQKINSGKTIKELCSTYIERHAKPHKKSWRKDESHINRFILPAWGTQKVINVLQADVIALHNKIGKTRPYEANRVLTLLSKMFSLGQQWGYAPDNLRNPAVGIRHYKEQKRDRWVTPEELPRLAQAINEEENIYAAKAIWLYLLTGLRKMELLQAQHDHISWERKELRLADNKSGRTHYVPLSESAIDVLKSLPRQVGNPYILPGQKPRAHLVNISKPWLRIRKKAGIEDVRLHDLRRTVGSWLAQSGSSLHLIGKILNHSSQATTAVYARFGQDHVREALEAHGEQIKKISKVNKENVIIFPSMSGPSAKDAHE